MKKIFSISLIAAATLALTTSCEDVPAPYDIYAGSSTSAGKALPYKSTNLNTGWTTHALTESDPWQQGSNYTQATGYQDWNGTGTKTNKQVEGYLVSPALSTVCESGKVAITFDHVIAYSNNDAQYADHIGMYISSDYDGDDFDAATWTKLPFEIESAALNSSWSLQTIPAVQVPDEYVNKENIYVAFYFYASANNSITWELENFYIMEGEGTEAAGGNEPVVDGGTTLETALTVAEANALIAGGKGLSNKYYVKGTVTGTPQIDTSYGNAVYYITDGTETIEIYRGYTLGGKKFTSTTELKEGDEVVVYGTLVNYNGIYEFTSGSQIVSLNGTVNDPNAGTSGGGSDATPSGSGSESDPYNVAGIIAYASKLGKGESSSSQVYFKGIISEIKEVSAQYGNCTFYVSDDGSSNNTFYVYRALGLNNQNVSDANFIKVGDEVVVCGTVTNYNGTLETAQKAAYVVSVKSNGGGDNGGNDTPAGGDGVAINGTTVTLTNAEATAGSESISVDLSTLGYENAAEMGTITLTDGTTIVFDAGSNKNAPKYYTATKGARVYANNTITFNGKKQIATVVMTCDSYSGTDYVGNATATRSVSGNTIVYNNASESAGTQLRVQTITITYAQ